MKKILHDPICSIPFMVVVGTVDELIDICKENGRVIHEIKENMVDGLVLNNFLIEGLDGLLIFFNDKYHSVQYDVVSHEVFHLWISMNSIMYNSCVVSINIDQQEYEAYHYENLFRMVCNAVKDFVEEKEKGIKNGNEISTEVEKGTEDKRTEQSDLATTEGSADKGDVMPCI